LPFIPHYATNNAHMFYIVCKDLETRSNIINHLKNVEINAVFHYLSLHKSPFCKNEYIDINLYESDKYTDCLLRLPMYYDLDTEKVINQLLKFKI
jgi:dTDP-4-amino-4,6-dideoxygalactose transaminase